MRDFITNLSQGDLIALSFQIDEANKKFSNESWKFPDSLEQSLATEMLTYKNLFTNQNFSMGDKERIVALKNEALDKHLVDFIRRVVHYVKALADDAENILNGYGYYPGQFPKSEGDIVALGFSIIHGDDESQGEPWAMDAAMKQEFVDAVTNAQTLMEAAQLAFGEQQETTQNQDESRVRLEKILIRCREWLYAKVPQGRHDEILEFYGFKPIREASRKKKDELPAPGMLMYDMFRNEFSWERVSGADKYELDVKDEATQLSTVYLTNANHKRLEVAKGDYSVKVRAFKGTEYSDWSAEVSFTIAGAPANLKYDAPTKKLSWNLVVGANLYELKKEGIFAPIYFGPDLEFVQALDPGTYKFRVRAGHDAEHWWTEWSEYLIVTI